MAEELLSQKNGKSAEGKKRQPSNDPTPGTVPTNSQENAASKERPGLTG
jgi:hypothetical protein